MDKETVIGLIQKLCKLEGVKIEEVTQYGKLGIDLPIEIEGLDFKELPEDYVWYITTYGNLELSVDVYGIVKGEEGLEYQPYTCNDLREYGMGEELELIEDAGEFQYVINKKDGKVYTWSMDDVDDIEPEADSFLAYLNERLDSTIEHELYTQ